MQIIPDQTLRTPEFGPFSSKVRRISVLSVCVLVTIVTMGFAFAGVALVKKQVERHSLNELEAIRDLTSGNLKLWAETRLHMLEQLASQPKLVKIYEARIANKQGDSDRSKLATGFKDVFGSFWDPNKKQDLILIDEDGGVIHSVVSEKNGSYSAISNAHPERFLQAMNGKSVVIPPLFPTDELSERSADSWGSMYLIVPVFASNGTVLGVLAEKMDPIDEFSNLLKHGVIGSTGETYCFDSLGRMMSKGRFYDQLIEMGMVSIEKSRVFPPLVVDPGINLTQQENFIIDRFEAKGLTKMAASALRKERGFDLKGYRDYRGVEVVGAWDWIDELGIGIATEIDRSESLSTYYLVKNVSIAVLILMILVIFGLLFFFVRSGEKVARMLESYKDELEDAVHERTMELQESEGRFRQLAATIESVFWLFDLKTQTFIYVSPAFELIWGRPETERFVDSQSWLSTIHRNDRSRVADSFEKAPDGTHQLEYRMIRPNGAIRYISERGFPVYDEDGRVCRVAGISEDITLKKTVDQQLKKLSRAVEQSPVSVVITNREGVIEYVNPYFTKATGYEKEEAIGNTPRVLKSGKHPPELYQKLWATILSGKEWSGDLINRNKNGQDIWEHAAIAPIFDEVGRITNFVGVKEDITGYKKLEFDLIDAKEAAETANRTKSNFLANMSHEIRTPMNAIIGMSHLALGTDLDGKQRQYVETVHRSANLLLGVINDILDFSKIEAGKLELESIEFSIDEVLKHQSSIFSHRSNEKGLELIFSLSPEIPRCLKGDPFRLNQILVNLIGNSVKFTEKGEILIDITVLSSSQNMVDLAFTVKDTGIGMTEEQIGKLFQPFSQADTTTTRKYGGTGLGLSITKKLVSLIGGEITIESVYGSGSTFSFNYPVEVADEPKEEIRVNPIIGTKKVLIVDDAKSVRAVISNMLEEFNFAFDAVDSGELALQRLEEASSLEPFDLVLLDWSMPGIDGIETFKRIQANPLLVKKPKVILVTAWGQEEVLHRADSLGFNGVLFKPMSSSYLLDQITEAFMDTDMVDQIKETWEIEFNEDFQGYRLLLVEDNLINQELAKEILTQGGFVVEVANNGEEGCELVRTKEYDIVLMDIHMPKMDGFNATKVIRGELGYRREKLPIIAMTANVMAGDRERCVEVGMNDYIGKPFKPDSLFELLGKYLEQPVGTSGNHRIEHSHQIEQEHALPKHIVGLNTEIGLMHVGGNHQLLRRLLNEFISTHEKDSLSIKKSIDSSDYKVAARTAHSLKGVSSSIGATILSGIAADTELAIMNGSDPEVIYPLIENMDACLSLLTHSLTEFFNENEKDSDDPVQIDSSSIRDVFVELRVMLAEMDPSADDRAVALREQLKGSPYANLAGRLSQLTHDFEFDDALVVLSELENEYNTSD